MNPSRHPPRAAPAFTLVEVVVVLGLIVALAGLGWTAWRRPAAPARDAALATVQSALAAARARAALRGTDTALLVHADPTESADFLRRVVVAEADGAGWAPVDRGAALPAGVFVLPETPLGSTPPGAVRIAGETWTDADGADLRSTALRPLPAAAGAVLGTAQWRYLRVSPNGTTSGGVILVATAQLEPGAAGATVRFGNPDGVAGLVVSRYGAVTVFRGRLER